MGKADAKRREAQAATRRWIALHTAQRNRLVRLSRQVGTLHAALARLRIMLQNGYGPMMTDEQFDAYCHERRLRLARERMRRLRRERRGGAGRP